MAGDLIPNSNLTAGIKRLAGEHGFALDAAQESALSVFERLQRGLRNRERAEASWLRFVAPRRTVSGIYLWGGVGRGKSFLMDAFFACTAVACKRRIHFHRFMQEVHHGLHRRQGQADPLIALARDIAGDARLICLDEFHITDITDAMLMRRLLEGLMAQGVALVTTSNFAPDELYQHGLQRNQFLPAIDLIKQRLEVVNLDGGTDYRLRELEKAGIYHTEAGADANLAHAFAMIAGEAPEAVLALEIEGRKVAVRQVAGGIAWFDFSALCEGPRGKPDYIELSRRYHTVLLSGVPRFDAADADKLRRFVWLVDEFYDRRVKLMIAAAAPVGELIGSDGAGDRFLANLNASLQERLASRLTEMQTRAYLSEPHLP